MNRRIIFAITAAVALITAFAATHAQQQIIGGRALDSSLQRGSQGFNTAKTGVHSPTYQGYRGSRVNARQNPAQHRSYGNTQRSYRSAAPRVNFSAGGSTAVATRGQTGGFNTMGNSLTKATYNPLSTGARVQRAPRPAVSSYRPPTYTQPTYSQPSYNTSTYQASGRASIPSYSSTTATTGLSGLTQPTYTTLRVGP
ncbi:MAG: hypothetical protein AAF297_11040 [Planctomycetota bacterium]